MPRITIKSSLLLTVYFSICASIYVTQNLAAGWIVVIATGLLIATTMVHAFNARDSFSLGFSVFAMVWLLICLGCSFETSRNFQGWKFQRPIFNAMRLGRKSPEIESFVNVKRTTIHDLYYSQDAIRHPDDNVTPSYTNCMRVVACVSSLLWGLIGGAIFRMTMDRNTENAE